MRVFITRCDSCGRCLYDYDVRYTIKLGNAEFDLCDQCVTKIDPEDESQGKD